MNLLEYVQSLGSDISLEEKIALTKLELKEILPTDIWNLKDLVEATKSINARVPK